MNGGASQEALPLQTRIDVLRRVKTRFESPTQSQLGSHATSCDGIERAHGCYAAIFHHPVIINDLEKSQRRHQ